MNPKPVLPAKIFSAAAMVSRRWPRFILGLTVGSFALMACAQPSPSESLPKLSSGATKAVNALWGENPLNVQFRSSKTVVVAALKGPAEITMIHFAYPERRTPVQSLNRDLLLRIYWDGENTPSVDCPLVDFFCVPNGERSSLSTALVNVRQGFNAYFPMPFRKSARIELVYEGPLPPGPELQKGMPCYSYVCYRSLKKVPPDTGYFCASWRQEELLLGQKEYVALEATGKGKFVGWNVTVRSPYLDDYPVDENEKFYIDGEAAPSIEFQGLEDSFGFSWGFPSTESLFPLTGYFPFSKTGAAAYRFFVQDAIHFEKSLKVAIAFGDTEVGWKKGYAHPLRALQFSSTVYWYQTRKRAPLPPMVPAAERAPAAKRAFWPKGMPFASAEDYRAHGGKLLLCCGLGGCETMFKEPAYSVSLDPKSYQWADWEGEVFYCRAAPEQFGLELNLPKRAEGTLRLFIIDPDNWEGGRKETIMVGGQPVGTFQNFQTGRWIEVPVTAEQTAAGKLPIQVVNARKRSNAVLSNVMWLEK